MPFTILENPTGKPVTAKATADGVQRVEATISGSITGAATSANQDEQEALSVLTNAKLDEINAGIPTSLGQTAMANSMPVVLPSDQMRATTPIDATSALPTRTVPNRSSTAQTTAGTPAVSLVVLAAPCWLYDIFVSNQSATTACYVTLYDAVAAPSHGGSAAARKIVGRRIAVKVGTNPLNFKETFAGLYFETGCVIVLEMAENDATANTSGAPTCAMSASLIPAT